MEETARSRRSAVRTLGLALAGAAGLWRFLTPRKGLGRRVAGRSIDVSAAEVPAEGALVLPQFGVAVVRDGPALAGIDLTCTHLGCTVTANAIGFTCPCHGSCFSCRGERLSGPATHSLRALRAEEENGVIHVANDGSVTEIAAERRVERS